MHPLFWTIILNYIFLKSCIRLTYLFSSPFFIIYICFWFWPSNNSLCDIDWYTCNQFEVLVEKCVNGMCFTRNVSSQFIITIRDRFSASMVCPSHDILIQFNFKRLNSPKSYFTYDGCSISSMTCHSNDNLCILLIYSLFLF